MQATIKHTAPFSGLRRAFAKGFEGFKAGMISFAESRSRSHEIERLMQKSDADLAKLGLRREDIVRHVFRDVIFS